MKFLQSISTLNKESHIFEVNSLKELLNHPKLKSISNEDSFLTWNRSRAGSLIRIDKNYTWSIIGYTNSETLLAGLPHLCLDELYQYKNSQDNMDPNICFNGPEKKGIFYYKEDEEDEEDEEDNYGIETGYNEENDYEHQVQENEQEVQHEMEKQTEEKETKDVTNTADYSNPYWSRYET